MLLVASSVSTSIRAAVLVFSNQTEQSVYFAITTPGDSPQAYRVAAGGTLGLWDCVNEELLIAYDETELTRTDCSA